MEFPQEVASYVLKKKYKINFTHYYKKVFVLIWVKVESS